jgi:hypothetical protein
MTDLTPRQMLDAIERALDRVAARFASQKVGENAEQRRELDDSADQTFETRRPD